MEAGIDLSDIDYVAVNRDPKANIYRKVLFTLRNYPGFQVLKDKIKNILRVRSIEDSINYNIGKEKYYFKGKVVHVNHHLAHLSSSYFLSGMNKSALCSVDGFGDFVSTMTGMGEGNNLKILNQVNFPHSLGLFYLVFTQYLGFPRYGDEYKVMGLSSFGNTLLMEKMREVVILDNNGSVHLNLDYVIQHSEDVTMTWENGEPEMGNAFSEKLRSVFGPPRVKGEEITKRHRDIASSMQEMYEEAFFHILNHLGKTTGEKRLCLSGGCVMNSVANGKIFDNTDFDDVFIQPAAGDAGGAIGAAYYVYNGILKNDRVGKMRTAYLGPTYSDGEIDSVIKGNKELQTGLKNGDFTLTATSSEDDLIDFTTNNILEGKVIGWFQGKMELGARALGNRSIIVDPRRTDMKEILNSRIKKRELFRPFAPTILREAVSEYFEIDHDVPFMQMVFKFKSKKQDIVPAVVHVDGTGRLQTVTEEENPLYYRLIKKFYEKTGVPIVLNTSFNENETIVNSPEEALCCFLRTKMDIVVMGNVIVTRK